MFSGKWVTLEDGDFRAVLCECPESFRAYGCQEVYAYRIAMLRYLFVTRLRLQMKKDLFTGNVSCVHTRYTDREICPMQYD